ncbi:hypothetical protein E6H35_05105 [Candidatus Bathyarchaeota archaeon]|nr:MAG: hypothetical protein E6H35_05105 [Candidatus Bathyarchaeota archaeon]
MDRAKALGIMIKGFTLFALYLGLANLSFLLNIVSLPLGATINNFLLPLVAIDIAILNLHAMYRRRQVSGTK